MQVSLTRFKLQQCLFPADEKWQDVLSSGRTKKIEMLHEMVFPHLTHVALVTEEEGWRSGLADGRSYPAAEIVDLYTEEREALVRYATSLTRERNRAEDLVQDAFVRAMSHLDTLAALTRGQRKAWLYRVIKNRVGKAIREFGLIAAGDRVLVALSGGKDSWTLLHILEILRRRQPGRSSFHVNGFRAILGK